MARYPSASWEPIAWMDGLRQTNKTQFTIHITAGESDPRAISTWVNKQAGSNFVLFRDGRAVQLSDSSRLSAADKGATHTISVECVGSNGPLTSAQVATLIRLIRDANRLDGVPLRLAATSSDAGIGWHRLGVDGNFPTGRLGGRLQRSPLGELTSGSFGKLCPTDSVIHQIHDVILPALTSEEDDFMSALSDTDQKWILAAIKNLDRALVPRDATTGAVGNLDEFQALWREITNNTRAAKAEAAGLRAAVDALAAAVAAGVDVDPAEISAAVEGAVTRALRAIETTVTLDVDGGV